MNVLNSFNNLRRTRRIIIGVLFLVILGAFCFIINSKHLKNDTFNNSNDVQRWGYVTQDEIDTFLKENNVDPISITQIYGFFTVILFQNDYNEGYYELYKDTLNGEVRSKCVKGVITSDKDYPVKRVGGTVSGNYPFTNFIVNDKALLEKGDRIELVTNNGTIQTQMSGQKGHTVEIKGFGDVEKIMIYDKQSNLIFN